jgi:hypothetical protein
MNVLASNDRLAEIALGARRQVLGLLELLAGGLSTLDNLAETHLVCFGEQREAPSLI